MKGKWWGSSGGGGGAAAAKSGGLLTKFKDIKAGYQLHREAGNGVFNSLLKGTKLSGHFSKLTKSVEGLTKVTAKLGKVGTASVGAVASIGIGSIQFEDIKKQIKELDEKYESGLLNESDYKAQRKELIIQKNEAMGSGMGGAVGAVAGSFLDEFLGPFGTILGGIIGDVIGGWIGGAWNTISTTVSDFWNGTVRDLAEGAFGKMGVGFVDGIGNLVDGITDGYGAMLEGIFGMFGGILGGAWDFIKIQFMAIPDSFEKIMKGDFLGAFETLAMAPLKATWALLKGVGKGLWSMVSNSASAIGSLFKGIGTGIYSIASGAFNQIKDIFKPIVNGVKDFFKGVAEGIWGVLNEETKEDIRGAIAKVKETWDSVVNSALSVWDGAKGAWNTIVDAATSVWDGAKGVWGSVVDGAKSVWDTVSAPFVELASKIGNWISSIGDFFTQLKLL